MECHLTTVLVVKRYKLSYSIWSLKMFSYSQDRTERRQSWKCLLNWKSWRRMSSATDNYIDLPICNALHWCPVYNIPAYMNNQGRKPDILLAGRLVEPTRAKVSKLFQRMHEICIPFHPSSPTLKDNINDKRLNTMILRNLKFHYIGACWKAFSFIFGGWTHLDFPRNSLASLVWKLLKWRFWTN